VAPTSVDLVVVALPTARPTWIVVERDDLIASVDASALLDRLAPNPAVVDPLLRQIVDGLTGTRLFWSRRAPALLGRERVHDGRDRRGR
jgi:hypothetical protein